MENSLNIVMICRNFFETRSVRMEVLRMRALRATVMNEVTTLCT